VVLVLHDLNLAARYADRLVAMRAGRIVAEGPPSAVLTEDLLAEVFGLAARVIPDPVSGTPLVVPIGASSAQR
jgi:iron complex transport system ATP-binding protein